MTFLRSVLLGLKRKIGEPIMILITVAIAVAIFVSAFSLRASVESTAASTYRALSGDAEMEAVFSGDSSVYFYAANDDKYLELKQATEPYGSLHSAYLFYASFGKGKESGYFAEVYATNAEDLSLYNPVSLLAGEAVNSRTGVVLSDSFAEKIGAKVGDALTVTRYGSDKKAELTVRGIAKREGVFAFADVLLSEVVASRLLLSVDDLAVYNRFFVDFSEEKLLSLGVTAEQATALIDEAATAFELQSPVNDNNVQATLRYQSLLLFTIAVLVAALGAVLIYTAVSLVMKERIATAALFKSAGASSGALALYLLTEIFLYGVVGSLLGIAGSYGVSAIFGALTGTVSSFSVGGGFALIGMLFGVVLSLLSSLAPVLRLASSPLYDLLHADTPILQPKALPAVVACGLFITLFLWSAFASVSTAFVVGIFAGISVVFLLFAGMPFVVKWSSILLRRCTADRPRVGRLYLAATGAAYNRHTQSGARLLAIAVTAVIAITVFLGNANQQLQSFVDLFRADIMISASSEEMQDIAAEARQADEVTGSYLGYIEISCKFEAAESTTVTVIAVRGQEYDEVLAVSDFGIDVDSLTHGEGRRAAISGGMAMKFGLSVGDEFTVIVDGKPMRFVLASLLESPLTLMFADLSSLGVAPNACFVRGTDTSYADLCEKYALKGAVYHVSDAFSYAIDLASSYITVFAVFAILVILFAAAGYVIASLASYRDRKREYELLSAAGASKGDLRRIVAAENGIVVGVSLIVGTAFAFALLFILQNMLKSIGLYFALLG